MNSLIIIINSNSTLCSTYLTTEATTILAWISVSSDITSSSMAKISFQTLIVTLTPLTFFRQNKSFCGLCPTNT